MTSAFSRLFSLESSCAEDSTCAEAEPISVAPRLTSPMLLATWVVPIAACWTLRAISRVASPCGVDRRRDGRGDARNPADGVADFLDRQHQFLGRRLNFGDLRADLAGGLRGLRR